MTFVVLANLGNFNAEKLALGVARQVEPSFVAPLPEPIADPDPQMTRRLRRVFLGMIAGNMNPEEFSDKLNRELGPLVQRGRVEAAKRAAENGDLESFVLLERKQTADSTELTYRADFEYQMRAKLFVSLDDSGKITNWGIRSAD